MNGEMSSRGDDLLEDVQVLKDGRTDKEVSRGLVVLREEFVKGRRGFGGPIIEGDTVHAIGRIRDVVFGKAVSN